MNLSEQFKQYLLKNNKPSKFTVKNYLADIKQFIRWFEAEFNKQFDAAEVTPQVIDIYKNSKTTSSVIPNDNRLSARSLERHLSSLRKFFQFLKLEGIISTSPFEQLNNETMKQSADVWHLRDFKNYLYVYNAAHLTIKNYIIDIKQFLSWAQEVTGVKEAWDVKDKDVLNKIDSFLIEEYKQRMLASGLSPLSINRKLSSIRKYINWLIEDGIIKNSNETTKKSAFADYGDSTKVGSDLAYHLIRNITQKDQNVKSKKIKGVEVAGFAPAGPWMISQIPHSSTPTSSSSLSENKIERQYSKIPPFRLTQKIAKGVCWLFDNTVTSTLISVIETAQHWAWLARGKKIFHSMPVISNRKGMRDPIMLNNYSWDFSASLRNDKRGRNNKGWNKPLGLGFKKEFYAPAMVSTKYFPLHKKVWHYMRYTRPKWYRTYHSYVVTHYFHFAIFVIFMSAIGFGFYQSFVQSPQSKNPLFAAGSSPIAPPRILSFQGRLTDASDNPITSAKQVRLAIYDDSSATGSGHLVWQELQTVSPDTDGIFSILLGNTGSSCADPLAVATSACSIPQSIFAQNATLYLGVTITNDPELTPRQQLATVAYATNAEVLQGLPPITDSGVTGNTNAVLALNSSGTVAIAGTATTTFQSSGGQITLNGKIVALTTAASTNTNILLSPDGLGKIDLQKPLVNTTNTGNLVPGGIEVNDKFGVLATESAVAAFVVNNNTTGGDIFTASSSGTPRFTIINNGNVGIGTAGPSDLLEVASGNLRVSQSGTPTYYLQIYNSSAIATIDASHSQGASSATLRFIAGANHSLDFTQNMNGGSALGGLSYTDTNRDFGLRAASTGKGIGFFVNGNSAGSLANASMYINSTGNVGIGTTGPLSKLQVAGDITPEATGTRNLGSSSLYWNNAYINNIISPASGTSGYWQRNNLALSPTNITDDLLLGATATSSAKFGIINMAGGNPTATMSSNLSLIVPTGSGYASSLNLLNNGSLNIKTSVGGDAGLATALYIANNAGSGNVGIGNTSPVYKLDVGPVNQGQSSTAGAAGLIRNNASADSSPYTQPRIIVYGGTGVDTTNWAYLAYGADAQLREVYSRTASSATMLWGTSSAMDGTGTFTQTMSLSGGGNLSVSGTGTFGTNAVISGSGNSYFNGGNVGIGTSSPNSKLDVRGEIRNGSSADASPYTQARISVYPNDGTNWGYLAYGSDANMRIVYGNESQNHSLIFGTSSATNNTGTFTSKVAILGNGNVGIGTVSPLSSLQVAGDITPEATGTRNLGSSSLYWNNLYANNIISPASGTSGYWQRNNQALSPTNITDDLLLGATATSSALVKLTGTNVAGLNYSWFNAGNVGIGTTNPTYKLDVNNGHFRMNYVSAPGSLTAAVGAGTGLTGTYTYRVTFVTAVGETDAGGASNSVTVANQNISLTNIPTGTAGVVTARKLYRGGGSLSQQLVTTINDNTTTTYTDSTPDGSLGAYVPSLNTTGGQIYIGTALALGLSSYHTIVGFNAGSTSMAGAVYNTLIGNNAGQLITTSAYNVFVGTSAGATITGGQDNVAIGYTALGYSNGANRSTAIGTLAARYGAGADNVTIGYGAGYGSGGTYTSSKQTMIGKDAGYSITSGGNNTFLGYQAGYSMTTGSDNVLIGYQAGYNETNANRLYIANTNTATPLIWGNFNTKVLTVYGNATVASQTTSTIGLAVKGASSQTANLQEWQNSSGTPLSVVDINGNVGIGATAPGSILDLQASGGVFGTNLKDLLRIENTDATATNNAANISFLANRTGGILTPVASISAILTNNGATTYQGALAFSTAGSNAIPTERLRIQSDGNVGVGTTNPTAPFSVVGTGDIARFGVATNTQTALYVSVMAPTFQTTEGFKIKYNNAGNTITTLESVYDNATSLMSFNMRGAGSVLTAMSILGSGNVGIGITNPTNLLHVKGAYSNATASTGQLRLASDTGYGGYIGYDQGGNTHFVFDNSYNGNAASEYSFRFANSPTVTFRADGNVGIGVTAPSELLHVLDSVDGSGVNLTSIFERRDPNTPLNDFGGGIGLYLGRGDLGVATESARLATMMTSIANRNADLTFSTLNAGTLTEGMRIISNGNVGVGTTSPLAKLDLISTTTAGTAVSITDTALTTGSALSVTGSNASPGSYGISAQTSVGVAYLSGNIGNTLSVGSDARTGGAALLLSNATLNSTTAASSNYNSLLLTTVNGATNASNNWGLYSYMRDATTLANTLYGIDVEIDSVGNAAKTINNLISTPTSTSTVADTIYAGNFQTLEQGAVTSGIQKSYGVYSIATSLNVNGGTANLYGVYSSAGGTVASGTINAYGLYVANGTMNTTGTSTNIGLYVESMTGADNNYAAIFAGGNVGIGTVSPGSLLDLQGSGGVFGTNLKDLLRIENTDVTATNNAANISFLANRTGGILTPVASISAILTNNGATTYQGALAFSTAGSNAIPTERLRIQSDGNVGIGTTSPQTKLHLFSGAAGTPDSNSTAWFSKNGTNVVGVEDTVGLAQAYVVSDNGVGIFGTLNNYPVSIKTNNTNVLYIGTNNRVGIGTTAPADKLDLALTSTAGIRMSMSGTQRMLFGIVGTAGQWITGSAANDIALRGGNNNILFSADDGTTAHMVIKSNGNVGVGTTSPGAVLDISGGSTQAVLQVNGTSNPEILLANAGNTKLEIGIPTGANNYITGSAVNDVIFRQTGGQKILFSTSATGTTNDLTLSNGNVGIGTTGPGDLLEVSGGTIPGIRITGTSSPIIRLYNTNANSGSRNWSIETNVTQWGDIDIQQSNARLGDPQAAGTSRLHIDNNGKIGIGGVTTPSTNLHINAKVIDDNSYSYDTNSLMVIHQTPTAAATLNDPKTVLMLARQGTSGQAYGAAATFNLSRYENVSVNSRTRLDLSLANASFDPTSNTVMTWRSNGNVGIGTTNPIGQLDVVNTSAATSFIRIHNSTSLFTATDGMEISNNGASAYVWNYENGPIYVGTNNVNSLIVDASNRIGPAALAGASGNSLCYDTTTNSGFNTLSTCSSSIRYKEDIKPLAFDKTKLLNLRPVDFKWKNRDERSVGLIAEETESLIPNIINYYNGRIEGVEYKLLTVYQLELLKEHENRINNLEVNSTALASFSAVLKDINLTSLDDIQISPDFNETLDNGTASASSSFQDIKNSISRISHFSLQKINGEAVTRIGVFSEAAVGKIKGGFVEAENTIINGMLVAATARINNLTVDSLTLATDTIYIGGQTIRDYIASVVQEIGIKNQESGIISPLVQTNQLATNIISPLASDSAIVVNGKLILKSPTVEIATSSATPRDNIALEVQGSASISGTLTANNLVMKQFNNEGDATVSGTLRADKIITNSIEGLEAKIATIAANYIRPTEQRIASSSGTTNYTLNANNLNAIDISSYSAQLAHIDNLDVATATFTQGLMSFGATSLADTSITGQLSINGNLILADNSINVLGSTLEIQSLKQGNISFMSGLITINTDGNLKVEGNANFARDVKIGGNLAAKIISPLPDNNLVIRLGNQESGIINQGQATSSATPLPNSQFIIHNSTNSAVLAVDQQGNVTASGSGNFTDLLAKTFNIVRGAQADTSLTETVATSSAGTATIVTREVERTIISPYVSEKSLIYITPMSDTQGVTPYVARQTPEDSAKGIKGSFTIQIPQRTYKDIKVNWWIVN